MNPFDAFSGLTLDGRHFDAEKLATTGGKIDGSTDYQQDILAFAATLFADGDTVTVKTSGSTGPPKSLVFAKTAVVESAKATNAFFDLGPGDMALLCLPMDYIAGKMMVARAITGGYALRSVAPCTNPLKHLAEGERMDFAPFTPHQAGTMASESPERLGSVGSVLLGGSAVNPKLRRALHALNDRVFVGFGMAETLSHFALAELDGEGEILYKPLPGVRIDSDKDGQIIVHRPGILNRPLHTRDVIAMADGGFRWLGRGDNLIISGGINVVAEEVERKLAALVAAPFFVAGTPHDGLGEQVTLFVEGGEGDPLELAAAGLDKYETPRRTVFVERFLYTESGKVRRSATVEAWLKQESR